MKKEAQKKNEAIRDPESKKMEIQNKVVKEPLKKRERESKKNWKKGH